ncbi:ATP synthase f0, b subunit [Heliomicrobium modesticaldum Ice1]|uniref:ATP synthase subunit b n=1 Tax=Heliobacterium modesticaldum (strain ATCC 51547 / Ice1) TaxID=498761 RepID=ATPF_HELMI|nr:F0F1 ATP synthase subunit B [Heliomicrobium modesticaldum]B0TI54.1 RecName: Full=ATP synthase subunit b; AltName: Full=ATP synthase F(0) sector subunit b; AltName: Full=ATPase subunit I; AltName: Full=F-type ATPase subunit b; Short=F-ATPase subunit b [Heliomicrobium modesticaldum Ice1]ABZ83474.1 ATP synthase f0, b subunit [Heliomicrobium modesticaldum Ice1]
MLESVLHALHLNETFLAMLISFLILVFILQQVAFKPILKALDERRQKVEESISRAENDLEEANRMRAENAAELAKARQEAHDLIARATKVGEEKAQEIVAAAQAEANRLKEKAVADIQREKEKALEELRSHVVNLSILAAEKVIRKNLDEPTQRQLVDEVINEVGKLPC